MFLLLNPCLHPPPPPGSWNSFLYYDINGTGIILTLGEDVLNGKSVLRDEDDLLIRILWISQFYQFNICHSNKPLVSSVLKALIINVCSLARQWNKNNSLLRLTPLFFAVHEQILLDSYIVLKLLRLAKPRWEVFFVILSQFHLLSWTYTRHRWFMDVCQSPSNTVQCCPGTFVLFVKIRRKGLILWPINKLIHKQC